MEVVLDLITRVDASTKELSTLKKEMSLLRKEADESRKQLEKLLSGKSGSDSGSSPQNNPAVQKVASLKSQLREAKLEAQALFIQAQKGLIPVEVAEAAQRRVANLDEELSDFNATIKSLNPEAKFNSIVSLGQVGVAGFQALAGAAQLFGDESESTQKAILKMQAVLNFTQGLNQLFGMQDALKNVGTALGITAALKKRDTAAQIQNTGATLGGAAAQGVAGGAITLTTSLTAIQTAVVGGLTTAWNVLKAVLITNPLGPILVLVGLIGSEIVKLIENLNKGTDSLKGFRDAAVAEQERLSGIAANQFDNVIKSARAGFQAQKDIAIANAKTAEEAERKTKEISEREDTYVKGILERQMKLGFDLTSEQQAEYNAIAERNRQARIDQLKANDQTQEEIEKKKKEAQDKAKQEAEKFQKEFDDLIKQLTERSKQALLATLDPAARIEQERTFAEQQIAELRNNIIKLGKETQGSSFTLTKEQEAQFKLLGEAVQRDYITKVNNLEVELARNRVDLVGRTTEAVIALYNAEFKDREQKLKQLGASEEQIREIRTKGLRDVLRVQFTEQIDAQASAERVKIQLYENTNLTREQLEEETQRRILQLDINTAQQKLRLAEILSRFGFKTNENELNQLKLNLKTAKAELDKFELDVQQKQSEKDKFSFTNLFGNLLNISEEDRSQFEQALGKLVDSIGSAFSAINDEKQRLNEQAIEENQNYIQSLQERINATQSALNEELNLQKQGYASNVDAKKRELALLDAEKKKALEKDKLLQKEKAKLAREEAIASSIAQTAGLVESSVNIFKAATKEGGLLGVVLGIAGAAALVAGFLSIKNRIQAATQFEKGGWINGPSHKRGGVKYIPADGIGSNIELEGNEFVIRKSRAMKYPKIVEAINDDNLRALSKNEIAKFLQGTGVSLSGEATSAAAVITNAFNIKANNQGVESRLEKIEGVLINIRGSLNTVQESYLIDGTKIVRSGNDVRIIRKA